MERIILSHILRNDVCNTTPNIELVWIVLWVWKVLSDSNTVYLGAIIAKRVDDAKNQAYLIEFFIIHVAFDINGIDITD